MTLFPALAGALGVLLLFDGLTRPSGIGSPRLRRNLESLASDSGIRGLTGARLGWCCIGAMSVGAVVGAVLTGSPSITLVVAATSGWGPVAFAKGRRDRRRRRFREAWPDAIALLIAGVRSGASLAESCRACAERGPDGLRRGFQQLSSTCRSTGSFVAGVARLRSELADPIADRVCAALVIAHEVGGTDLVRALRTLADFIRDDLRIRREIEARWSWTVTAARLAAAAPWVVLVLMATRPEAARAYGSPSGTLVVGIGALATLAGYRLMLRAARLPEERRLGP